MRQVRDLLIIQPKWKAGIQNVSINYGMGTKPVFIARCEKDYTC